VYGFFIISIIIYFGSAINHHPHPLNWNSLQYLASSLLGRVVTEVVVGPLNRNWLQYLEVSLIFGFLIAAMTGGLIGFFWKKMERQEKWFYVVSTYFILVTMSIALLGRELGDYYHVLTASPRYTYLPRVAFLLMMMAALYRLYQISTVFQIVHFMLAIIVVAININGNVLYQTNLKQGQQVRDFVAYLDQNQQDCTPGEERRFTLHRGEWRTPKVPGDWSIIANLCRH
jgi:hypothetical protein